MNEHSTSSFKFTSNNSLTVPIANNIAPSISGPGGGWNSVFAAASTIIPLETNLSDDEQPVNAVSGVEPCVSNISRLANTITDISPDTTISSNTKKKKKKKKSKKRKLSDGDGHGRITPNTDDNGLDSSKDNALSIRDDRKEKSPKKKKKKKKKRKENKSSEDEKADDDTLKTKSNILQCKQPCPIEAASFPFPTDPDDHCETPMEAYKHVSYLLTATNISIYDPYYCNGTVKRHLSSLGYNTVYNEKVDCYRAWEQTSIPNYDVLITNPPYSSDHIAKLIQYLTTKTHNNRPWCLCMPNFVHKKDYYLNAMKSNHLRPFYIIPKKRYIYQPPANFRSKKKSDTHVKSSPFVSMWYCWGGTQSKNEEWMRRLMKNPNFKVECDLARSKSALRDLRRKR